MEIQILVYNEDEKIYEKELASSFEEAEDILAKLKRTYDNSDTAERIMSNSIDEAEQKGAE